jgi:hypothetical protein
MGINHYPASGEVVAWLQSLSGALTKVNSEYASFPEMVEHPDWDEKSTDFTLRLLSSLSENLSVVEKELRSHVNSKFG